MKILDKEVKVLQEENFPDLEIESYAIRDTIQQKKLANGNILVAFLAQDDDCQNPLEDCDGMGRIKSFERGNFKSREEADEFQERHKPYGVQLSCYRHSGDVWSIRGEGYRCRWDTIDLAGLWYPDECCKEHIDAQVKSGKTLEAEALVCARQALEVYNQWLSGECYGVCTQVFNPDGEELTKQSDSCWGYIGIKYAEEELAERISYAVRKAEKEASKSNPGA